MSIRDRNEHLKTDVLPDVYDDSGAEEEMRAKRIYERYHTGKSVTIDDLKFLLAKDPEGCRRLVRGILETKSDNAGQPEPRAVVETETQNSEREETIPRRKSQVEYCADAQTEMKIDSSPSIRETMRAIKAAIEGMTDEALKALFSSEDGNREMSNSELLTKYWDDAAIERIFLHNQDEGNRFDSMA